MSATATAPRRRDPRPARHWATINDAAEHIDVSTKTIRRMIAAGELPGYRIGKRALRVDLNDLDRIARPIPTAAAGGAA